VNTPWIGVASAEEALEKLAEGLIPDLIFLDLLLPLMTGEDFLKQLRQAPQWEELPIVICSSAADRSRVERVARLGIDGYLLKPIAASRLREVFREVARACVGRELLEPAEVTIRRLEFSRTDYLELLIIFGTEAARRLAEVKISAEANDKEKLKRQVDSLRATAANIGAMAVMVGAEKLGEMVNSATGNQLGRMITQLEADKQRTDQEIKRRTDAARPPEAVKPEPAPSGSGWGENAGEGNTIPAPEAEALAKPAEV
jgi:CheY-like chemotaxis protein/HPt (histidine-containing phosphotransfer) domain-containing protein